MTTTLHASTIKLKPFIIHKIRISTFLFQLLPWAVSLKNLIIICEGNTCPCTCKCCGKEGCNVSQSTDMDRENTKWWKWHLELVLNGWVSTQRVTSARNAQKYNSEVLANEPSLNNLFIDSGWRTKMTSDRGVTRQYLLGEELFFHQPCQSSLRKKNNLCVCNEKQTF